MRRLMPGGWLLLAAIACAAHARAAEPYTEHTLRLAEGEAAPRASLDDAAWLVGAWDGECFEMRCEEVWNPPSAGTMIGLFKLYGDEGVRFYELMLLTVENGSLVMKIKHFNADFSAWEDKAEYVSFPLVRIDPEALHFRGLSFYRRGEDAIDIWIALHSEGTVREHLLTYRRAAAALAAE